MQQPLLVVSKRGRIAWIDIYKGIAISFVVAGHVPIRSEVRDFLYIFHMYAFFFISGMMCRPHNVGTTRALFRKQLGQLYIPYLVFSLLWNAFAVSESVIKSLARGDYAFDLRGSVVYVVRLSAALLYGTDSTLGIHIGPAWFLMALFVVKMTYALLQRLFRDNMALLGLTSVVLFFAGYVFRDHNELPFSALPACTAIAFYYLGHISGPYVGSAYSKNTLVMISLVAVSWFVCYACAYAAGEPLKLLWNELPECWLFVVGGALSGICALVLTSKLLSKSLSGVNPLLETLVFLGQNSLIIMGIQSPIIVSMLDCFGFLRQAGCFNIGMTAQSVTILVVTLLISIPICRFLNATFPSLAGARVRMPFNIKSSSLSEPG